MDLFEEGVGRKQVLPKREFIFDLSNIMRDFKDLENCGGDKMKRSQIIHQVSYSIKSNFNRSMLLKEKSRVQRTKEGKAINSKSNFLDF
jgi:hypothetical protein